MVRLSRSATSCAFARSSGGNVIETVFAVRILDIVKHCQVTKSRKVRTLPAIALYLATFAVPPNTPPSNEPPVSPSPPASSQNHLPADCSPPILTYKVDPEFTLEAQKAKVLGKVLVALTVDAQGNPVNVHIFKSLASTVKKKQQAAALSLDQRALDAVKQYRFKPATCAGKPVAFQLQVEINFQIVK
jgi:TonB family protein